MDSRLDDTTPRPLYFEHSREENSELIGAYYYKYHLTFKSEEDAQFVHNCMETKHQLPVTISGREVVILPKKDGNFGIDVDEHVGICCRPNSQDELHSFLTKNTTNKKPIFSKVISSDGERTDKASVRAIHQALSRNKRQALMRHPFYQAPILWEIIRLFKYFPKPFNLPKEVFNIISRLLFSWNKNLTQDVSLTPLSKRLLLNQLDFDKETVFGKQQAPKFYATYLQLDPPVSGSEDSTLHLRPQDNEGKNLAANLLRFFDKDIQNNQDYTEITISVRSRLNYIFWGGNIIERPTNETDSFLCQLCFDSSEQAFEFTQIICLMDQDGNKLEYWLDRDIVTLMPPPKLFEISHLQEKKPPHSALKLATINLKQILDQNKNVKNLKISTALTQLEQQLTNPDQEACLNAIQNFENTCGIDLGTNVGQAVALLIVAAAGFVLGAVIGEAIGVGFGNWSDIASATSKIIDEFLNGTIKTITSEALAVLGAGVVGGIAAPALTYGIFFKPTKAERAAEKVASEAKSFVENTLQATI